MASVATRRLQSLMGRAKLKSAGACSTAADPDRLIHKHGAAGVLIAYAISSFCATMDVANAVVPTILAIMLFLSGFLIR